MSQAKTVLYFANETDVIGIIAVADTVKDTSIEAIKGLKEKNIDVIMLTGDNKRTADIIAKDIGIANVISDVLPSEKAKVIKELKEKNKNVMMCGDGINDSPALANADIGVSVNSGTDIAMDSSDVILTKNNLGSILNLIKISKKTVRNIKQNLFWAFFYNIIGIPLAAGVWIPFFGWQLNPMFGAAAMSLSSFCVVTNALRLNLVDVYSTRHDKKRRNQSETVYRDNHIEGKGENTMTKTMKIEGMMCGHCEARVKKCLETLDGVESAEVSHEKGTAVVTLSAEVADEVLKKAVEEQDYMVKEIQ